MSFKTWLRGNKDEEPENKTEKEADGTPPPVKGKSTASACGYSGRTRHA
jgi:hypothetical protein